MKQEHDTRSKLAFKELRGRMQCPYGQTAVLTRMQETGPLQNQGSGFFFCGYSGIHSGPVR